MTLPKVFLGTIETKARMTISNYDSWVIVFLLVWPFTIRKDEESIFVVIILLYVLRTVF